MGRLQRSQKASLAYDTKFLEDVANSQEIDQRNFLHLINRRRKPINKLPRPVVDRQGRTVRDLDQILQVWKEYYCDLYTPLESEMFDTNFKETVDRHINEVDMEPRNDDSVILSSPITSEEVKETCQTLKVGKAPGLDGIQSEHLKYAGPFAYSYLA